MIIVYTKLRSQNCTIHVHGKSMLFLLYAWKMYATPLQKLRLCRSVLADVGEVPG